MGVVSAGQRRRDRVKPAALAALLFAASGLSGCGNDSSDTAEFCAVRNDSGPKASYTDAHHFDICTAASDVSRVFSASEGKARLQPIVLAAFLDFHRGAEGALKNFPGGSYEFEKWNNGFEEKIQRKGISLEFYNDPERKNILHVAGWLMDVQQSFNPVLTSGETYVFARMKPVNVMRFLQTGQSLDADSLTNELREKLPHLQKAGYHTEDTDLKQETSTLPDARQERARNMRNPTNQNRIFSAFLPHLDVLDKPLSSPTPTTKPSPPLPYSTATQLCALGKPVNDRLDPQVIARGIDLRSSEASNGVVQKAICVITAEAARFIFGSSSVTDLHQETYGVALVAKDQTLRMTSDPLGLRLTSASIPTTTVPNGSILHTQRAAIRVERNLPEDQLSNSQVFNAFGATLEFDR